MFLNGSSFSQPPGFIQKSQYFSIKSTPKNFGKRSSFSQAPFTKVPPFKEGDTWLSQIDEE
jgi:hypothetical protein